VIETEDAMLFTGALWKNTLKPRFWADTEFAIIGVRVKLLISFLFNSDPNYFPIIF